MNIFYLSECPIQSAKFLIDRHVNKMISESAQMLANCYSKRELVFAPKTQKNEVRKHSYFNHPCSIWVRESIANFNWLVYHAIAMSHEKVYRTNKGHFSYDFILWCLENKPQLPNSELTSPAQAFEKNYPHLIDKTNPVQAYRNFYIEDKRFDKAGHRMDFWTKRNRPDWFPL